MINLFRCTDGKCPGKKLINHILEDKGIPIELKLFKVILKNSDMLKDFTLKKEKELGLSYPQIRVLWMLRISDQALSQAELSSNLETSKANLSTLLDRMENAKLIERVPDKKNKRIKLITITKSGEKRIDEVFPKIQPLMKQLFKGLSRKEMVDLMEKLEKIRGNINEII